jgi:two-component system, NarL family, nitrate/nitrite response regulator NarL
MILLASPSKTVRQHWRNALLDLFQTCEISDKRALVHLLEKFEPTVVFLDYDIGGLHKTAFLRDIIQLNASLRVMVFTSNPTRAESVAVIKAGAKGYGRKSLSKPLLKKAARVISQGELWIGRDLVPMLIVELLGSGDPLAEACSFNSSPVRKNPFNVFDALSPRQFQIASLIATGQQNKAISNQLNIDEKTVKAHLTAIFRKLGLSSRTQLALAMSQNEHVGKISQGSILDRSPVL